MTRTRQRGRPNAQGFGYHQTARTPAELAADTAAALMHHGPLTISDLCRACGCSTNGQLPRKYLQAFLDKDLAHETDRDLGPRRPRYAWGPKPVTAAQPAAPQNGTTAGASKGA